MPHIEPSQAGTAATYRVVDVLRLFIDGPSHLGVSEAARRLGLSKAVVHRILLSLVSQQMLEFNTASRRYRLGPLCAALGARALRDADIRVAARPHLLELVAETRETASVSALIGDSRVCVEQVVGPQEITMRVEVGARHSLHAGATGNAILAFLAPDARERVLSGPLERLTPNTVVEPAALRKRLDAIARDGIAMSFRDHRPEACGVAAPVFGLDGSVCGAISLAGPAERFTAAVAEAVAPKVGRVAREVSKALGWSERPR